MTAALALALSVVLAAPAPEPPVKRVAAKSDRGGPKKGEDASRGGTRRGLIELGLGAFALGTTGLLVGRGAWEVTEGNKLVRDCRAQTSADLLCARENPRLGHDIAAGLAFAFAVPMALAAGFLLARGIRIERDRRAFLKKNRVALTRGGVGLHF